MEAFIQAPADFKRGLYKVFESTEHSANRNSSHWTRIRRVPSSNPGSEQTDWGSFRGFSQS